MLQNVFNFLENIDKKGKNPYNYDNELAYANQDVLAWIKADILRG